MSSSQSGTQSSSSLAASRFPTTMMVSFPKSAPPTGKDGPVLKPGGEPAGGGEQRGGGDTAEGAAAHADGEVVTSYASLERKLAALGWERYYSGAGAGAMAMLQFHKRSSVDLISLPKDFSHFGSVHMYDIVVKNRDAFRVIDV
ncbi:hypothetical protein GUJ93_ZPchr0001g29330 [Zizania palustris]|uniref:Uncharacterized protein n=1 Tax=Zizania palustris TaxID=103762 RepID=A0A8J5V1Q0_ZIZPA|nr:hypothetical protein GUJ93_ZPchr0001g29330 [Zizania palustris]